MAKLRIKAPDGKTLVVAVPEGTDPSQYDALATSALAHYQGGAVQRNGENIEPGVYGDTDPVEQRLVENTVAAGNGMMIGSGIPSLIEGGVGLARKAAGAVSDGLAIPEMVKSGWNTLTGNTPAGMGFAKAARGTQGLRDFNADALEYANSAHPDLGDLVAKATKPVAPEATNMFASESAPAEAEGLTSGAPELGEGTPTRAAFPELPAPQRGVTVTDGQTYGELPKDAPAPAAQDMAANDGSDLFNHPIRKNFLDSSQKMYDMAAEQQNSLGNAIEGTLKNLDKTGTHYDPTTVVNQVKSMLERDVNGSVMTTGPQGAKNAAIDEALAGLRDFSRGGTINWSDASRIKTMLQDAANYTSNKGNVADEAYKQVANLLKEDIDNQAQTILQKSGGAVDDFKQLREAYGKTSALKNALNNKLASATGGIPWWAKAAGATYLGGKALGVVKGLTGE